MSKRDLSKLQNKIQEAANKKDKVSNTGGFYYPHWNLPFDGETSIRILEDPNLENVDIVYIPYMEHSLYIDNDRVKIPCIKNLGKDHACPICELSSKFYDKGDRETGKKYYRGLYSILRALVVKDGLEYSGDETNSEGQIKMFKFSYQLATKLDVEIGKLRKTDYFWELKEGINFSIVKNRQPDPDGNDYGKYDLSSGFDRYATDIPSDWDVELPTTNLCDELPKIPTYDEANELLQRHLMKSVGGDDNSDSDNTDTEEELMEKLAQQQNNRKQRSSIEDAPVENKEADTDDDIMERLANSSDDDDDNDDDILAQLRND
jgi:hypothetical protein